MSGALNPSSARAQIHAEKYYDSLRKMNTDCARISENTGCSRSDIEAIKKYVFLDEHDLGGDVPERFDPCYEMAESWQRLIDGRNIQQHDLTLLAHEKMEAELVAKGLSQLEAHVAASEKYNYGKEAKEYYGQIGKNQKNAK